MPINPTLYRLTLLLVALAATLVQVSLYERQPQPVSGWLLLACSAAIVYLAHRKAAAGTKDLLRAVVLPLVLIALPIVWDVATRLLLGIGDPYEVQLAYVLRNLMLVVVAQAHEERARNYAVFASFFLVLFCSLWTLRPLTVALLIAYGLVGLWWLMERCWKPLIRSSVAGSETRLPLRPASLALALVGATLLAASPLANTKGVTTALRGLFPSSGGTSFSDPLAHGGVGDGEQMVAAKDHASSFGPMECELYLESEMPSLYDAFNESSESVPEKKKRLRRAIPLAPGQSQFNHQKRGLTQQASREFSAVRQTSPRQSAVKDIPSAALLLWSGRTPMNLALEAYDQWDGRSFRSSSAAEPLAMKLQEADDEGNRWLELQEPPQADADRYTIESQVRVVNLRTDRVPTPTAATAVTMDGLHAAAMFRTTEDGSLAMDVSHVPQLTIFRFRSVLRDRNITPVPLRTDDRVPPSSLRSIATAWTADIPEGWRQVEAIVERLRRDYVYDPTAMAPDSNGDAVEHFLEVSRRGPDYLFAASAAVLVRSLGYEARVRSGFYVNPKNYDRISRLTPITAADAHFWVEVLTVDGEWIAVEPTSGFEMLYAPESVLSWLVRKASEGYRNLAENPLPVAATVSALAIVLVLRRRILDAGLVMLWFVRARRGDLRRRAQVTLWTLEWRAWTNGRHRPAHATLGRWDALSGHGDFLTVASWAIYGEGTPAPLPDDDAYAACRRAALITLRGNHS
jgi:transglutaminase-like putative cysteine protease